MSAIDSTAVFESRCNELGIEDLLPQFKANGWTTHAKLAYAADYTPGAGRNDKKFIEEIAMKLVNGPDDYRIPGIRRLHFESFTMAMADVQRKVSRPEEEDRPKMLPKLADLMKMTAKNLKMLQK